MISDYTVRSMEPVANRSWPRIRIEYICTTSFKDIQREHRERTLDANNVFTEQCYTERFRPELNSRVNYPIKRTVIDITDQCEYDMSNPVLNHCVSWVINFVCKDATDSIWSVHGTSTEYLRTIRGIPIESMLATRINRILTEPLIPTTPEADECLRN